MARTLTEETNASNHQIDPKAVEEFFTRLDRLHDAFEAQAGEFRADVKALYGEASDKLGASRKIVKHAYQVQRQQKKLAAREAEFEDSEKDNLDRIRAALGDFANTPLGNSALQ